MAGEVESQAGDSALVVAGSGAHLDARAGVRVSRTYRNERVAEDAQVRRDSRNSRQPGGYARRQIAKAQEFTDDVLARIVPRTHKFVVYRLGEDMCARCQKTRKEHE